MVYRGESHWNDLKWMRTSGTLMNGNPRMTTCPEHQVTLSPCLVPPPSSLSSQLTGVQMSALGGHQSYVYGVTRRFHASSGCFQVAMGEIRWYRDHRCPTSPKLLYRTNLNLLSNRYWMLWFGPGQMWIYSYQCVISQHASAVRLGCKALKQPIWHAPSSNAGLNSVEFENWGHRHCIPGFAVEDSRNIPQPWWVMFPFNSFGSGTRLVVS